MNQGLWMLASIYWPNPKSIRDSHQKRLYINENTELWHHPENKNNYLRRNVIISKNGSGLYLQQEDASIHLATIKLLLCCCSILCSPKSWRCWWKFQPTLVIMCNGKSLLSIEGASRIEKWIKLCAVTTTKKQIGIML